MSLIPRFGRLARLFAPLALVLGAGSASPSLADSLPMRVRAGIVPRQRSIVRATLPVDRLGLAVRQAMAAGPVGVAVRATEPAREGRTVAQVEPGADSTQARLTWVLPADLEPGESALFAVDVDAPATGDDARGPWVVDRSNPDFLAVRSGEHPIFRYNMAPVANPSYKQSYTRDAYIHPAHTPSGTLITGDFSAHHPHHRGIFLAYAAAKVGDIKADFWNIQTDKGKIVFDGLDSVTTGAVCTRIEARHRWELQLKPGRPAATVLNEHWTIEVVPSPDPRAWVFDLTSTQRATDQDFTLTPYRYGGMAYRGPEPFVKGPLDVLTSAGKHRFDGDQKPARWVDLTGPIVNDSPTYAGAMIADHPENPRAPTIVRIHPVTLPFFSYVPAHDLPLTIARDQSTTFRYRVMIHDGRPDPKLNEQVYRDFADPVHVTFEPVAN